MAFGVLAHIEDPWLFFGACMIIRFIHGIGCTLIDTASKLILLSFLPFIA